MADLRFFPYIPRTYQEKIIELIQREIEGNKNICIQAPSGFGKTITILSALLPFVENSGVRIIWAVKTGNQTDRPIEELKIVNKKCASGFFGFSFRGKRDMCLLAEKYGSNFSYEDVHYICKHVQDECKYVKNINKINIIEEKILKQPLCYSEILKICKKYKICPYKIQCKISNCADVLSVNYNYILNDFEMSLPITDDRPKILVVDEAHNLQNINTKSCIISFLTLKKAFGELEDFFKNENKVLLDFFKNLEEFMDTISKKIEDEIEINKETLFTICNANILDELKDAGMTVRAERLRMGKLPRSSIYKIYVFFSTLLASLNQKGIVLIAVKNKTKSGSFIHFEIFDMRAEEVLKDKWENYNTRIFCSGTLNPIDAFAEICGIKNYTSCQIPSSYTSKNILPLIINGLTTKGAELEEKMKKLYVKNILDFIKILKTNIAIFSASYRIQNYFLEEGLVDDIKKLGKAIFIEESDISGIRGREILLEFKKKSKESDKAVLIAPLTGRFAEGVDFPHGELGGIYIAGIPFDKICARTNAYLNYYKSLYGPSLGRYYGYILPALKKVSQAIGRGLRSENDRCVVILGDERFIEQRFFNLLPDFVRFNAKIINQNEIEKYIKIFKQV